MIGDGGGAAANGRGSMGYSVPEVSTSPGTDAPPRPRPGTAARRGLGLLGAAARAAGAAATRPAELVFAGSFAAALALFRDAWRAPGTSWVGGCCDPEQSIWFLRWTPYALQHGLDPFVTTHLNTPQGVNLLWNAAVFVPALLLAPVTVTLGPVVAYNLLLTLAPATAAGCAFLALRRHTRGPAGPAVGGLLYGFSPYMLGQSLGHANLVVTAIPPLALLLLDHLLRDPAPPAARIGTGLGVLAALQLLTSEEVLATSAVSAGLLLGILALLRPGAIRSRLARFGSAAGNGGLSFAALASFPLMIQFAGSQRLEGRVQRPDIFVTDLVNLTVPTDVEAFSPHAATQLIGRLTGLGLEQAGYLGLPLLLLLGVACGRLWHRIEVRAAALTGLAILVLSLGPHLHVGGETTEQWLPWSWVARVPLLDQVLPARLMLFVFLAAALVVAVLVDDAVASGWRRAAPLLAAVTVALLPLVPETHFPASTAAVPTLFVRWDDAGLPDGAVVLLAPYVANGGGADIMLWQAEAGMRFRMPQGYAFIPGPHGDPIFGPRTTVIGDTMDAIENRGAAIRLGGDARREAGAELRTRGVSAVVVGPMRHRALMLDFLADLLGRAPESLDGVEIWRHVDVEGVALTPG